MPKINTLQFGIEPTNPAKTNFTLELTDSNCNWVYENDGKVKLNISLTLNKVEAGCPKLIEIGDIKNISETIGIVVLNKDDTNKIPISIKQNYIKFDTDMSNTTLGLEFTLAGKAGGTTSGKAGGTTPGGIKAGGTTNANLVG